MTTTVISFYPTHINFSDAEHDAKIAEYREWLDQHGTYGKLYMMNIGKVKADDIQSKMIGLRIFDYGIAVLFKLTFEV
jgi:hypothetical protein